MPPIQQAKMQPLRTQAMPWRQPMQASRAQNFMPPVQASKSPIAGLLDIVIPVNGGTPNSPSEELDIIMPITKREMMAAAAASAAAALPLAANAEDPASVEKLRKVVCVRTPTAKICQ